MKDKLRELSRQAYCDYMEQLKRPVCLGVDAKLKDGMFGKAELEGHIRAAELLGRHRALAEAAALSSQPSASAGVNKEQVSHALRQIAGVIIGIPHSRYVSQLGPASSSSQVCDRACLHCQLSRAYEVGLANLDYLLQASAEGVPAREATITAGVDPQHRTMAYQPLVVSAPASDLRAKLESLRELSEKATAGEWIAIPSKIRWHGHKPIFADGLWHIHPEPDPERLPICEVDRGDDHDDSTRQHAQIEAEFIVACVNAIRAILEGKD